MSYERSYQQRGNRQRNGHQKENSQPEKHYDLTEENYVETADQIMNELLQSNKKLTTSKIRNILAMVSDIYNEARMLHTDQLDSHMIGRIQYLRLHIAYEAGRDKNVVGDFVRRADLLNQIQKIGNDRKKLILFCHYMEALVAYHRFYGGRDN